MRNVIDLDAHDARVREFFESLPSGLDGTEFEVNGRRAFVFIEPDPREGTSEEPWTARKNEQRCQLIDGKIEGTLSLTEAAELAHLQLEMCCWLDRVAPLPSTDARALHRELIDLAESATSGQP